MLDIGNDETMSISLFGLDTNTLSTILGDGPLEIGTEINRTVNGFD